MISLCSDWEFTREWSAGFAHGEGRFPLVDLPHTAGEVPLHYAKPEDYAGICGYRRGLSVPLEYRGKRLFLQFDGAAHFAEVYLNGEKLAEHACGYTAFRVEITSAVRYGMENRLAVRLDTTENPAVPPFGFVLDYLAYGGLYREVWLDVRGADVIEDVFVTTPTLTRAEIALTVSGSGARRRVTLLDAAGAVCAMAEGDDNEYYVNYSSARPWTLDEPNLYSIRAELLDAERRRDRRKDGPLRLSHGGIPPRRFLSQRRARVPPRPEPSPVLSLHGLRRARSAPARGRADTEGRALLHGGAHVALSAEPALYRCVRRAGAARFHRASRLAAHRRRGVEAPVGGECARDGDAVPQSSVHRPLGRSHQRKSGRR